MKTHFKLIAEKEKQEVICTCLLDAPRSFVFDVFTNPVYIPEWWGPENLSTMVDKFEVKPGGTWRLVQTEPSGRSYAFRGVFHDISKPNRIIQTFECEDIPGHVLLETISFEELGDQTNIVDQSVFQSIADRDGMLASGMEDGSSQSMSRLAKLLEKLKGEK